MTAKRTRIGDELVQVYKKTYFYAIIIVMKFYNNASSHHNFSIDAASVALTLSGSALRGQTLSPAADVVERRKPFRHTQRPEN
jgi:hypothetical protein